jgi:ABC-type amino acid transport substrate-binding protein
MTLTTTMKTRILCAALSVLALLSWGPSLAAGPLKVAFGVSRPPFVMEQEKSGIAVDLFHEAARRMNVEFEPHFLPRRRILRELNAGYADVGVEMDKTDSALFYSSIFTTYSDVVVSRTVDGLNFRSWKDLVGRQVCAWQGAKEAYGSAMAEAMPGFGRYEEFGTQRDQIRLWLIGRCQVLVVDQDLLHWHLTELSQTEPALQIPPKDQVALAFLSTVDQYVAFRDGAIRDSFDKALGSMRRDGTYKKITEKYLRDRRYPAAHM